MTPTLIKDFLKSNRARINKELGTIQTRRFFSPALYGLSKEIFRAIEEFASGKLLDIGCGDMPYRDVFLGKVEQYDTLDIEARASGVTYLGSAENMEMISSETYDSAACFEVLEHLPDPFAAIREACRVLKKDGVFIISVPHLSRLHEEPNDFFRYTTHGLRAMLENNGFKIVETRVTGSLLSFLGHQTSSLFLCFFWHIPVVKSVVFFLNRWLCVMPCHYLDHLLLKRSALPLGYVCVARKK